MTDRKLEHRPLMGGTKIVSARPADPSPQAVGSGTLTGLATRNNQKVLITCLHVMAGVTEIAGVLQFGRNLRDDEDMYQVAYNHRDQRVGDTVEGRALQPTPIPNRVDGAYCVPHDLDREDLSFYLHGNGAHESKLLIADTVTPEVGMQVKILGSRNGEYDVTISSIGDVRLIGGRIFSGVVIADRPSRLTNFFGDSGAPVVKETAPGSGLFNMVGVLIGGNVPPFTNVLGEELFILPAHEYESAFGITFGKRPTTMHVFASPAHANVGDTVFLNGSGSLDPDGGDLTFLWEQIEGPDVENFLTTNTSIASFTVPEGGYGSLRFRLTATDEYNLESAREVIVNRNPVAKIAEVADAGYLEEVTLDGSNSIDYARATEQDIAQLTYLWQQVFDSDPEAAQTPEVTLTRANTASASFTAPAENHRLKFKLTVTDRNNLSHSAEVTINVENKPPVADAGEDAYVEVSTAAPLNGSGSSDEDDQLDELSFNWQAPAESGVTILNPDHMETTFLAPSTAGDIVFTLTVTDPHDASASATVTKMVRVFTWSEWQDVDPLETRVSLLNADEFEKKQFRTSNYGTTQYQWVPDPDGTWGPWTPTGNHQGCGPDRQAEQSRTSNYQNTETRFVADPEPKTWSAWMDTGDHRGCGPGREAEQSRISHCGDTETQWVSSPESLTWSNWSNTGDDRGCGPDREAKQSRTSQCGDTQTRWVSAPEALTWSNWSNTGDDRGCGPNREAKQSRTSQCGDSETRWVSAPEALRWSNWSNTGDHRDCGPDREAKQSRTSQCGDTQTRWVSAPEALTWSNWGNTGSYRGCGPDREAKQSRTSQCGDTQTRWVSAPEALTWSNWSNTGDDRGCGPNREAKQSRTSQCGDTQTRWVDSPVPEVFGDWTDTTETRGATPCAQEKKQTRTGDCGSVQTRWVDDPQPETWGEWEDTGEVSGILDARSKKQKRTSDCNNIEYRWVPVMTEWGPWERTGDYQGCGPNREAKEERISNFGDVDVQWVPAPEADPPGPWSDTGNHRGCGPDREKEQTRTYKCGRTETQWIAAAEALVWGKWKNLNEYRISPDDELIRQRKQERTDQCGNKETRWVYYEPVDQSPVWSVWSDTGKTRGATPCVQEKEQQRTSDQGETQTRWVDDAQPETWGRWIDTGEYRENPDTFITEYEQKRTSNCGNVEYRWSE